MTSSTEPRQNEPESDIPLLREQSENLAYAACHHLLDLSYKKKSKEEKDNFLEQAGHESDFEIDEINGQFHIRRCRKSDGTAQWLFELAFESFYNLRHSLESQEPDNQGISQTSGIRAPAFDTRALAIQTASELHRVIYEPGASAALIGTLLADWTSLSKEEIARNANSRPATEKPQPNFILPSREHVPGIRSKEGRYDFTRPDDNLLPPVERESPVEPGIKVGIFKGPMANREKSKENIEQKRSKVPWRGRERGEWKLKNMPALFSFLIGRKDLWGSD
ncbi:hypothetical protein IL306_015323 [Fusarium sp. DS 682]|nr:hypothetical protein IL306_015323 [Fusarium sp. DS 682]